MSIELASDPSSKDRPDSPDTTTESETSFDEITADDVRDALAALDTCAVSLFTLATVVVAFAAQARVLSAADAERLAQALTDVSGATAEGDTPAPTPAPGFTSAPRRR